MTWDSYFDSDVFEPLRVTPGTRAEDWALWDHKDLVMTHQSNLKLVAFNPADPAHYISQSDFRIVMEPSDADYKWAQEAARVLWGFLAE